MAIDERPLDAEGNGLSMKKWLENNSLIQCHPYWHLTQCNSHKSPTNLQRFEHAQQVYLSGGCGLVRLAVNFQPSVSRARDLPAIKFYFGSDFVSGVVIK
jgi:hypothetical protein